MQSLFFHPGHVNLDNHICDLSKRYSVDHLGHGPRKLRHHDVAIVIPIKGVEEIHQLLLVVRDLLYYARGNIPHQRREPYNPACFCVHALD